MKPEDELAAAQQVVDMFATEALLALDTYQQSVRAYAPGEWQRSAQLLAHWWRTLRMDDVQLGHGTGSEQILVAAAEISLNPDNHYGVDVRVAREQADKRADREGRPRLAKGMWQLREEFEDAYGGEASVPSQHEEWLAQSLTRLARAAVLRDVIALGAQVRVSEPLRAAADEVVRQGQRLTESHQDLAARQAAATKQAAAAAGRKSVVGRQAGLFVALAAYGAAVDMSVGPLWAQIALKTPVAALYLHDTLKSWRDHQNTVGSALDPAQAQLRSVRTDLIKKLGAVTPATREDTHALRTTNRPTGHDR